MSLFRRIRSLRTRSWRREKKIAEGLAESQRYTRGLIEASLDALVTISAEGKITDVNHASERLTGVPREEIIGTDFSDYFTEPDQARAGYQQAFREGTVQDYPLEIHHQNGHITPVLYNASIYRDAKGEVAGVFAAARDITERKRVEAERERYRASMQVAVDQLPDAVLVINRDYTIALANREAKKLVKEKDSVNVGEPCHLVLCGQKTPCDDKNSPCPVRDVFEKKLPIIREYMRSNPQGEKRRIRLQALPIFDGDGEVVQVLEVLHDVTEYQRVEEDRQRLARAIEQVEEIIVITDPKASIEYVNPAFEKITGYSSAEVLGKNPRLLKSGKQSPEFYQDMWNTLGAGNPWRGRLVNKKKDGSIYTEEAMISPVFDEAGVVINYVAAKQDVTQSLMLEEQLRQSQKMEVIGQMAGGVAHDFNNLLQVICGFADLLQTEESSGGALGEIKKAAERGKTLVSQLLAFSRRQVIAPVDLDLGEVVRDLLGMIQGVVGEHIQLDVTAEPGKGIVHADRGQMEQVLVNLCVNARDAMPQGGVLTLQTENAVIDRQYAEEHSWAVVGQYVRLSVTDTGCGMSPQTLDRIFEPFFTTKEVGKGTGLGLSMVYGIIQQQGGNIRASSVVGEGTTLEIYLPLIEREQKAVPRSTPTAASGGTEVILVAEDDEAVLQLAETILRRAGYTVFVAQDGEEAVRVFKEHMEEIDMILLDVVMPRMGGKVAFEKMTELKPGIPHLFTSGYSGNVGHTNFIQNPELNWLGKPYASADLLRKIRAVLDENQ